MTNSFTQAVFEKFRLAARYGDIQELERIVEDHGTKPVNMRGTPDGKTPLMEAASGGKAECVRFLLEHGAWTDVSFSGGVKPLMLAAQSLDFETVAAFLVHDKGVFDPADRLQAVKIALQAGATEEHPCVQLLRRGYNGYCADEQKQLTKTGISEPVRAKSLILKPKL